MTKTQRNTAYSSRPRRLLSLIRTTGSALALGWLPNWQAHRTASHPRCAVCSHQRSLKAEALVQAGMAPVLPILQDAYRRLRARR